MSKCARKSSTSKAENTSSEENGNGRHRRRPQAADRHVGLDPPRGRHRGGPLDRARRSAGGYADRTNHGALTCAWVLDGCRSTAAVDGSVACDAGAQQATASSLLGIALRCPMPADDQEDMTVVPIPSTESDAEHQRIRSSNDRDQELEREGKVAPHNRGYDE